MLLGWRRCGGGCGPVERDQLRAAEVRLDDREQDEAVALGEPVVPFDVRGHEVVLHGSCSDCRTAA